MRLSIICVLVFVVVGSATAQSPEKEKDWSRLLLGRGSPLASNDHLVQPAGMTVAVSGRVMCLALARGGKFLLAKTDAGLAVVETEPFRLVKHHHLAAADEGAGSMYGLAVARDGASVYFTGRHQNLYRAVIDPEGKLSFAAAIDLSIKKKPTNPLGVALTPDEKQAVVALAITNEAAIVDLPEGKVAARIPVGICPYGVVVSPDGKTALVSNFGGRRAEKGERTERSAGTSVPVDEHGIAQRGTISVIDLAARKVVDEIATRIYPESMVLSPDGKLVYLVDASGDGINVIDLAARRSVATLDTRPQADLPYGSLTCGLAVSGDGRTLLTANAGNNAVAMLAADRPGDPPFALIPAGGFPGSVCLGEKDVYIGNVYGFHGASLQKVPLPTTPEERKSLTAAAQTSFHLAEILRAQARAQTGVAPRPVPARPGEPSPIEYCVYIIKENKKFDQVLGDMGRGNCEPKFCELGRKITPNTHALADEFVLLDNYYCNGVKSNDGHQWADQGVTTPYREKDYAGAHATYDFGVDPLCYASCGCIWDHVLRGGLSFRNFGELGYPTKSEMPHWTEVYRRWKTGKGDLLFATTYHSEVLRRYSDPRFAGWTLSIPDQVRADFFLKALGEFEASGRFPSLVTMCLPNDHSHGSKRGWPTARAYAADNDLALGRVVEALSKSRFWREMVIFVNEDDPQTGVDHVDGHRSLCLVAGPYVKRGAVVSRFYNQSSVLHTICQVLGLPPMNQTVASAPLLSDCFQETADYGGYVCRPAGVNLDEMNGAPKQMKSKVQAALAPQVERLDFSRPDLIDADAELLSRYLWASVHGDEPFPAAYFGAHGKGLKALGLRLDEEEEDEDGR